MAKQVRYAYLHNGIFIPGVGNLKETLPPDNKTLKNFQMAKLDDGNLELTWFDPATASNRRVEIGAANVKLIDYAPEKVAPKPTGVTSSAATVEQVGKSGAV